MQAIDHFKDTLGGRRQREIKPEEGVRVLVYGPRGQLKEIKVRKTSLAIGPGAGICYWDEIHERPRIQGDLTDPAPDGHPEWGFYRDLCAQTGGMEYYKKAKRYFDRLAKADRSGEARPLTPQVLGPASKNDKLGEGTFYAYRPVPEDWYHPVLMARRGNHFGGSPEESWDSLLGEPAGEQRPEPEPTMEDDFSGVGDA